MDQRQQVRHRGWSDEDRSIADEAWATLGTALSVSDSRL
jgi:hypothetical protein